MMKAELNGAAQSRFCIGASGTPIVLSLVHLGLQELNDADGPVSLSKDELQVWSDKLFSMKREDIADLHPSKMKGRADVLPAGVLILKEALHFLGAERLYVSPFGVRHGVAIRYFLEST